MTKSCGRCRRFLSPSEGARCHHCDSCFHKRCVSLPPGSAIAASWRCPECIKKKVGENKIEATVSGTHAITQECIPDEPLQQSSTPENSTFESTEEIRNDIAEELMTFRNHLRAINKDLSLFKNELADVRTSLKSYIEKVDKLENRVSVLEQQKSTQPNEVMAQLQQEIRERDQELLANDIEIVNVPETNGENPTHLVMQIGKKLGMDIEERDIVSAERVGGRHIVASQATGPDTRVRPLAVRLARRELREKILISARTRRGATSTDLGIAGTPRRFYVNERLTKFNRQLFRSAREGAISRGWRFVWIKRGRILVRKESAGKVYQIRSEIDLDHFVNSTT